MRITLILVVLFTLPLVNSFFVNTITLVKNISEYVYLRQKKQDLICKKQELSERIKTFNSSASIKRTIKERLKLIEANEILLRLG